MVETDEKDEARNDYDATSDTQKAGEKACDGADERCFEPRIVHVDTVASSGCRYLSVSSRRAQQGAPPRIDPWCCCGVFDGDPGANGP